VNQPSENTYQNLSTFDAAVSKPSPKTQPTPNPDFKPSKKPESSSNDYSVEALLRRKRSHNYCEPQSDHVTEDHGVKQRRLDQNDLSCLNSIFTKQQEMHRHSLGLPLHPQLAGGLSKFTHMPYPTKSIFTGTTTYGTDSLVNMAPFAGTLVGGGHYQW
jgi:hypothetical protein